MPQQFSERFEKLTWKIVHYYCLALGLLPAPLNAKSQQFQYSGVYLVYSALIQCLFLVISPLGTPLMVSAEDQKTIYMHDRVVLQWTYYIGKTARILTIVILILEAWTKRQNIIDLYENYRQFEKKYERFCQHYDMAKEMQSEINTVKYCTIYKFCTAHCNAALILSLFLKMQHQPSRSYVLMVIVNFTQSYYLLVANIQFFMILSRMHLHFVYISKSLELMLLQKCTRPSELFMRCWILYDMHCECRQLSMRILRISRKATLFMFIKVLTTNVVLLYHAVQFVNQSIESDETADFMGMLTIVCFYWDAILTMIAIDNILTSCNRTAEILCYFPEVPAEKCNLGKFSIMLSQFHQYLACHKLEFYIFGMFPLNKATCLAYFTSALVHLTVLVQFDLKASSSTHTDIHHTRMRTSETI